MSPVTIGLDAQFGTPYPRSAGFDTDNNHETCHLDPNFKSYDSYFVEFAPTTIHEKFFAYVESSKFSMLVDCEKNALGAGYIVEFIHDATENYYEGGTYACRNCNNIKFPPYVLQVLKL